jgi:hypothetical protein
MTTGVLTPQTHEETRSAAARFVAWTMARRLHVVCGALLVIAVALQQNLTEVTRSPFHPDESRWLNRASYTEAIFHPLSSAWEDRYLIRGQPPGGSYITGIGLLLQGHDLDTNGAWDFHYGNETVTWWNVARGNMPSWDDILAARRTSAVLGAVTALCLFVIVTRMSNLVGGMVAGLFLAIHPLSVYLSSLGVSDAAFTTLVALSTLAAMSLAAKPTWPRALLLGLALGAGAATKLSPLLLACGLAAIGVGLVAAPLLWKVAPFRWVLERVLRVDPSTSPRLGWMLIAQPVITAGVFILTYPFLWPDPLGRTRILFDFRRTEMDNQARIWVDASIDSRLEAFERIWSMLEHRYSATEEIASSLGGPATGHGIDILLAVLGLAIATVFVFQRGLASPTALGLAVAGGQALLIIGGLRVDFDRYYLPIVFLLAIGVGVLGGWLAELAAHAIPGWARARAQRRSPAADRDLRPATAHQSAD